MDRRTALATAGAIAIVTITGGTAIAANVGVLSDEPPTPAGQLQPTDAELRSVVVEPSPSPEAASPSQPGDAAREHDEDDGEDRDDDHENDDGHDDDDEREYDGADDDD